MAQEFTKWELAHMANARAAFQVRKDAPEEQVRAWLASEAEDLANLRRDVWIPHAHEIVADLEKSASSARSIWEQNDALSRVAKHRHWLKKHIAEERAFRRLAAKLRESK